MPRSRARGLAPVELVIWLPVFVLMGALIVNLGTMQTWRLRGELAARNNAHAKRWVNESWHLAPPPEPWRGVSSAAAALPDPVELDPPGLSYPAVRGPLNGLAVRPMLAPGNYRAIVGQSRVERALPLISSARPYDSQEIRHLILDGSFTARQMGLRANTLRRSKLLYDLPIGGAP